MLIAQKISYILPNKDLLFSNIDLTVNKYNKVALIGNNGAGKSTLLKIIAKELQPNDGQLKADTDPYYVPQIFGQYNHLTIAQAMGIENKINALKEILAGIVTENNLHQLDEDWTIEEKCTIALDDWQLKGLELTQKMESLSGGQKTKVLLAGIALHEPEFILLDEPSNHLDSDGRQLLYDFVNSTSSTLIIVSHDRKLLNLMNTVFELSNRGITIYGGNYDFYSEQKQIEKDALNQDIHSKEKSLRKAREMERETLERQHKLDARGKGKQKKAGVARIMMNKLRNNAENSTSKIKSAHAEKIGGITQELLNLRTTLPDFDKMKFGFNNAELHNGKKIFTATNVNFSYHSKPVWNDNLNIQINSGERISIKGLNGSGKTTLIKLILGNIQPQTGIVYRPENNSVYIDQDYSLINNQLNVYEQAQQFNTSLLQEHEIKIRLNRFLFTREDWDKPCAALSGGERMRLMLCCLTISNHAPDIIILDEPTNNLDIQNIEILIAAINEYQGTLIVVSHDEYFLEQVNVERIIRL
jgi:ATPase subunit of ABC transporter with duplicated ATPase domains